MHGAQVRAAAMAASSVPCHQLEATAQGPTLGSRLRGAQSAVLGRASGARCPALTMSSLSPLPCVCPSLRASQAKVTEECSQYEFENYMRQQLLLAEEKSSIHEARSWVPKRQFGSVPPVRRLGHDAQPMTSLDTAILAQRYLRK